VIFKDTLAWVNLTTPSQLFPGLGSTSLHFVPFPPSSVFADPSFDGEVARTEALIRLSRHEIPALENATLRFTRAVYRAGADLLPRVMSPGNAPIAQPVPGASRCASVR
jgi:hypothetical protein